MLTEKELAVIQRRAKGESQKQIARALGISQAAVSKFESNAHRKIIEAEETLKLARRSGAQIEQGATGKRVAYRRSQR